MGPNDGSLFDDQLDADWEHDLERDFEREEGDDPGSVLYEEGESDVDDLRTLSDGLD